MESPIGLTLSHFGAQFLVPWGKTFYLSGLPRQPKKLDLMILSLDLLGFAFIVPLNILEELLNWFYLGVSFLLFVTPVRRRSLLLADGDAPNTQYPLSFHFQ